MADSIFVLDDDSLATVCQQLQPIDQANFATACPRFRDIFTMVAQIQYREFTVTKSYCELSVTCNVFYEIVAPQIKALYVDYGEYCSKDIEIVIEAVKKIRSNCTNVETLTIFTLFCKFKYLFELIQNMENLTDLEIYSFHTDDDFINHLKRFKKLKKLKICGSSFITGKHIEQLIDLEKLSFSYTFLPDIFKNICENLKNLQHLETTSRFFKYEENSKYLCENLPQLKVFKTTYDYDDDEDFNFIPQLPKLEQLVIEVCAEDIEKGFFHKKLLRIDGMNLSCLLFMMIKYWTFREKDFLPLLTLCPELEYIYLKSCEGFKIDAAKKILELLREQQNQGLRKNCVYLDVTAVVNSFQLDKSELNEYSDVLKISFHYSDLRDTKKNFVYSVVLNSY